VEGRTKEVASLQRDDVANGKEISRLDGELKTKRAQLERMKEAHATVRPR
jgi:hypothetical protein